MKIAADEYPSLKILATGSSTLEATKKFQDSLTGRKIQLVLFPVLWTETRQEFNIKDLDHRLLRGGLPEQLLAATSTAATYSEWIDSFYARDIHELFAVRNRQGFLKLFKLLLRQSGGLADFSQLAKLSGLSRPTVMSHIEALQISHAIHILTPFHGGSRKEITQRPKIYGFDTGFISFIKGWEQIRPEDRGYLWEHLVLDILLARQNNPVHYWRDKNKREIDFVIPRSGKSVDAIECKINSGDFDPSSLKSFRQLYPKGRNFVLSPITGTPYNMQLKDMIIEVLPIENIIQKLT